MSMLSSTIDTLISEAGGMVEQILPLKRSAGRLDGSRGSMTTTSSTVEETPSASIEELCTAVDELPLESPFMEMDAASIGSDINTIHRSNESGPPLFERTVLQYHDIQVNVPESRVSLTATEVDTEPSLSHSSAGQADSSRPMKIPSPKKDTVHNVYDIEELVHEPEVVAPVTTERKVNPVSQTLKMNAPIKKFKLANAANGCGDIDEVPLIVNSPIANEVKLPTNNTWVLYDYEHLFGSRSFQREIDLAKSLRFIDEYSDPVPDLREEDLIYISTRIINPAKILSMYLEASTRKRDLYLDLIMSNNGCNILLQLMKYFKEHESTIIKLIDAVHVRILASYVHQIKVVLGMFTEMGKFFQKIKTLGLFIGIHQYENGYVLGAPQEERIKLPSRLDKIFLSNGLKLTDFSHLPISVKHIGLHNVHMVTFSKFNLSKHLESLHISGDKIELNTRLENFPPGFYTLRDVKFDASVVVNFNFEKFSHLSSLSLLNVNFGQSRQLEFPMLLKKLEFINCALSSHVPPFPDTLKMLVITGGKWSRKKNANLSRLQRLKLSDVHVKDLTEKLNACHGLLVLEISNCSFNDVGALHMPSKLSTLKLVNVNLNGFKFTGFPATLEQVDLENNDICSLVPKAKLKSLRIAANKLAGRVDMTGLPVRDINLEGNKELESLYLHDKTTVLTANNTTIQHITGSGLTKLVLDGCSTIDWKQFKIPQFVTQLSLRKCDIVTFDSQEDINHVKMLDLGKNKLKSVSLAKYTHLEDVELSSNNLTTLVTENFPATIKSINAMKNRIAEVRLQELALLDWLQLSDNKLTSMQRIQLPPSLSTLILNHNNFGEINDSIIKLPEKLRHLELKKCKIAKLDLTLGPELMSCSLNGNKLYMKNFQIRFVKLPCNLKFLDLGSNFFKLFDFSMVSGIDLAEINLANNMFDEVPDEIPDNILSAIIFKVH
ncbi:hypothetical protein Cantr_04629 [Candida viswanathii]|uniref:Uncharacterized protein n=1 Tax=Candida viswanathii TaxID=5486 RepID=A0A367XNB9_9ASCO|nr:hypothetical protein Cantr_04629 [Candida viswanathii]